MKYSAQAVVLFALFTLLGSQVTASYMPKTDSIEWLYRAISNGDKEKHIPIMLERCREHDYGWLNQTHGHTHTPLTLAAACCDHNAAPDVVDNYSNIVKTLLRYGALPSVANKNGDTPLHLVRHHTIARILFTEKAYLDINALNNSGQTPLDVALSFKAERLAVTLFLESVGAKTADKLPGKGCIIS